MGLLTWRAVMPTRTAAATVPSRKSDLGIGKLYREHLADGQHHALAGQGHHVGGDLHADADAHQHNAHRAEEPLFQVIAR